MKKLILALLLLAAVPAAVVAQTPSMMTMAQSELQKRGLNEVEVRARLLQEGIDVDNIPPTEYANYQGRVLAVLNKMQAEKSANNNTSATVSAETVETAAETPKTTEGEAAAESAVQSTLAANGVSPTMGNDIYGHSLFTGKGLEVFRTTDGAQAPDHYVLGEGDEVHISIFGSSQTEIHQRIASDGSIQPAGATKIFLKGMTLAKARTAVQNKLAQHYSFRSDQIAVTITTARTVSVSIYGEVGVQGGFTLSALNTAFNALAAAGGPTAIGSVRNIQMSRAGKVTRLDIYQFMKNPTIGNPYDLQNGDVLYVPIAQKVVSIEGAVKRPMRYEMIDGETLSDLIEYAGGLSWNVYPKFVQIERIDDGEVKLMEYNLKEVTSGGRKVELQAGDIVRIKAAAQPNENYVTVSGNVYYAGNYDLQENMTVNQAIEKAGGLRPSYFPVAYIFRPDLTNPAKMQYIPIDLNKQGSTLLQARDNLNIYDNATYSNVGELRVSGAVKNPISITFDASVSMHDLLSMAGGFTVGAAYDRVEIYRVNISKKDETQLDQITLKVDENYNLVDNPNFQLQPYDHVVVRLTPNFTMGRYVELNGRVKYPGVYVLEDNKTQLSTILEMAGGLLEGADPYAIMVRTEGRNNGPLGVDFKALKKHPGSMKDDPILMNGDVITVARQENVVVIRETGTRMSQYVGAGLVNGQKIVTFQGPHRASWYVKHTAGGYMKTADRMSVTVTYPNNQMEGTRRVLGFRRTPKVQPGSVITMNIDQKKERKMTEPKEKFDWSQETSRMMSGITSVLSVILLVNSIKNLNK